MNNSMKNSNFFSIRPEDSGPIQLEWQWVQKYLGVSYLLFKTFGALLALIIVLADQDETSAALILTAIRNMNSVRLKLKLVKHKLENRTPI